MGLLGKRSGRVVRSIAGLAFVAVLGGCSFVPDWADPTEWSYRWANPVNWYEGVFGEDDSAIVVSTDPGVPGEDEDFPSLSSVPDRPITVETSEDRAVVAEGLVADREQARYTDEVIRTDPEPVEIAAADFVEPAPKAALEEIEPAVTAEPSEPRQALTLDPLEPLPETPPVTVAPMEPLEELTAVPTISELAQSDFASGPVAPAAVELVAYAPGQEMLSQVFAQLLGESASTVTTAPANMAFSAPTAEPLGAGATAVPDVVRETYNESLAASAVGLGAETFEAPAAAGPGGLYQGAVINFNVGSSRISPSYREALQQVVAEHEARGGFIRVVGHASSRTRDLPIDRHMLVNFRISLERAEAVARELVRLGASPGVVFIEARSDAEPVYYESMPAGEAENRRAEVFLEF
jgi:outer membrane protein OmpA-like peptidoglycan-associated protein